MKKLLITFVMLLSVIGMYGFDYTYQGVTFKCKINGQSVSINSFTRSAFRVVVPAKVTYNGKEYLVKSINVFSNGDNYSTVTLILEEGIEDIKKFCFNEFRDLRSVTLPSTIKHIGSNAFRINDGMTFELTANIDEGQLRKRKEIFPAPLGIQAANDNLLAQANDNNGNADETPHATKPQMSPTTIIKPSLADIDVDIPIKKGGGNEDTYCVIIANGDYEDVPKVEFAVHDGEVFKEYCMKTLGIPEKHIKTFINASYTDFKRAINWMETIANVTDGKSKLLFYYSGHGIPNDKDKAAYLIPIDGFPKDITTCYKLSDLYDKLGKTSVEYATIFLDACFSGMNRGSGDAMIASRGVAITPRKEHLSGNLVVFTATSADETALAYQSKQHGMFTYYLLSELKETKGKATFGEWFKNVTSNVKKNSFLENEKLQTPSVITSANMKDKWQSLQF